MTREARVSLALLRKSRHLTQAQVAKKAGMTQSEISKAEQRSDCLVTTLERYAKALGGRLQLVIEIDGQAYAVTLQSSKRH
jgi:transcriptional regulator with XRE-family HTH domain